MKASTIRVKALDVGFYRFLGFAVPGISQTKAYACLTLFSRMLAPLAGTLDIQRV